MARKNIMITIIINRYEFKKKKKLNIIKKIWTPPKIEPGSSGSKAIMLPSNSATNGNCHSPFTSSLYFMVAEVCVFFIISVIPIS